MTKEQSAGVRDALYQLQTYQRQLGVLTKRGDRVGQQVYTRAIKRIQDYLLRNAPHVLVLRSSQEEGGVHCDGLQTVQALQGLRSVA